MSRVIETNLLLGSLLGDSCSHPGKTLVAHLRNVADFAQKLADKQGIGLDQETLTAIASTHDIGKVHPKFQQYLKKKGSGVNHAKPSAWFTYSLTKNFWAAEVVCRHHTHLRNLSEMIADWQEDDGFNPLQEMEKLLPGWPWLMGQKDLIDFNDYLYLQIDDELSVEQWLIVRAMYSLLVAADRMEAIGIGSLPEKDIPTFIPPVLPSRSAEIDTWRGVVKETCLKKAREVSRPGVYTLTLPTGTGKTLTGLSIAHEWAKRFGCQSIIYGLPFISIVEQTTSVAKDVFGNDVVQEDHSLVDDAEKELGDESDARQAWKKMSALFRYWREPVVLTTMVQIWEALFNPKANRTMNFHRLSKAVVILDEPQTISPRYWEGLGDVLSYLGNKWGSFFLLMTATQPHIPAAAELAPANTAFPYPRHCYQVLTEKNLKIENLPEILEQHVNLRGSTGLIVMNRKKAALEAYRVLEKMNLEGPILFLSGWVTPWRRRVILRYLRWLEKKGRRRYLVATQVVEAGVDLDFEWVFRDLGPLDSVIQVAGRCNRHSRAGFVGKVIIAELVDENNQSLWRNVYDPILIDKAREVLKKNLSFAENEVYSIVDEYYKKITDGLKREPIGQYLANGQWEEIPRLYDENGHDGAMVFIEENQNVLSMLRELEETEWTLDNRDEKKRLLQKARQYAIEIPANMIEDCKKHCANYCSNNEKPVFYQVFNGQAWFLGREGIKKNKGLYDPRIGFIPPTGEWNNFL